jgi:hypothetical protein
LTYGLLIDSDVPLPGLHAPESGAGSVRVSLDAPERVRSRFTGAAEVAWTLSTGDGPVDVIRGAAGDLLMDGGDVGLFHLSPDGSTVDCATPDPGSPVFLRMLLDTVLGTAGLQRGLDALHAAAVTVGEHLVALAAAAGAGKSTLAAELIRRGAQLFTDDLLFLTARDDGVLAHPGPAAMNLPAPPRPGEPWRVLAPIGSESWATVERPQSAPRPLALLVLIDRRASAGPPRLIAEPSPPAILGCSLDSGPEPDRLTRRLELLARLARTTPVMRLAADSAVPPGALAETVLDALPEASP